MRTTITQINPNQLNNEWAKLINHIQANESEFVLLPVDDMKLGGAGWITDPNGVVLGVTSDDEPFITIDLDLTYAEASKSTYPRYVDDSEIHL